MMVLGVFLLMVGCAASQDDKKEDTLPYPFGVSNPHLETRVSMNGDTKEYVLHEGETMKAFMYEGQDISYEQFQEMKRCLDPEYPNYMTIDEYYELTGEDEALRGELDYLLNEGKLTREDCLIDYSVIRLGFDSFEEFESLCNEVFQLMEQDQLEVNDTYNSYLISYNQQISEP